MPGPERQADKRESDKLTTLLHNEIQDGSFAIGCFDHTYLLYITGGSKSYQELPRCMA